MMSQPQSAARCCRVIRSVDGPVVAYDIGIPEADYIVHTANAYPRLVELLAVVADQAFLKLDATQRLVLSVWARALLAELGELPAESAARPGAA
jgi:hypothetical protein